MKLGAFIIGGLAGAAVVMLLRNQSVTAMTGGVSQMLKSSSGKAGKALMQGLNVRFGDRASSSSSQTQTSADHQAASSGDSESFEQLKNIVSKDEQLKKDVNDIFEQNKQPLI